MPPPNIPAQDTSETEYVPKTQVESSSIKKRSHKKKDETEKRTPKKVEFWSPKEEFELAKAWLDVSEDEIVGDDQDIKVFWGRTREKFFAAMGRGVYRTADSFSGKWGAMRLKVSNFNNIYNNLVNNTRRRSGVSDVDVVIEAHNDYRMHHGHMFTLVTTWELLRKSPNSLIGTSQNQNQTTAANSQPLVAETEIASGGVMNPLPWTLPEDDRSRRKGIGSCFEACVSS
ncbi:glutathione S-transferase T2-like [Helianthus annuus]|uniref:glutathione S-transferase T2-like n=1 Tax=Helianthus annuus TaxID=4232 RepID=UPI000B8FE131|nr:glutathione S-transferase T2-like [Helianthus annuus]